MKNIIRLLLLATMPIIISGCVPNITSNIQKAQVYIRHGHYEPAIEELKAALDVSPENAAGQYWLGYCYEQQNEMQKCIYHYGLAAQYDPSMELAQMAYINTLYKVGQNEQSLEALQRYVSYRQAAAHNFQRLAEGYLAKNMFEHANIAIMAAQRVEPRNPRPFIMMIDYYEARQDNARVSEYIKAMLSVRNLNMSYEDKLEWGRRAARYGVQVDTLEEERTRPAGPTQLEQELRAIGR